MSDLQTATLTAPGPSLGQAAIDQESPLSHCSCTRPREEINALAKQLLENLAGRQFSYEDVEPELVHAIAEAALERIQSDRTRREVADHRLQVMRERETAGLHPVTGADLSFYSIPDIQCAQYGSLHQLMDWGWVFTFKELASFGLSEDHADKIARSLALHSLNELGKTLQPGSSLIGKITPESVLAPE